MNPISMLLHIGLGMVAGQVIVWCADRLPADRSLIDWRLCPVCGEGVPHGSALGQWLIALGWLRCDVCGAGLRWRTVATAILTTVGFGFLWTRYPLPGDLYPYSLYWAIFVLICLTDLEHRLILNEIILVGVLAAIVGSFITTQPGVLRALLGGVVAFLLVFLIFLFGVLFSYVMARRRGKPMSEVAFGAGDVKLAAFIGLVTGFPEVIFALVIGILAGGVFAAGYLFWQALIRRRYVAFTPIPYGPFLIAGGLVMMLFGSEVLSWYLSSSG